MKPAKRAQINRHNPDEEVLREAAEIIHSGGLVIIPTETVYGIAANMLNRKAVERLARIKERPKDKPFSLHIYKRETVEEVGAQLSVVACKLMDAFWPGPLTLIFRRINDPSIGIRMPADEVAFPGDNVESSTGTEVDDDYRLSQRHAHYRFRPRA